MTNVQIISAHPLSAAAVSKIEQAVAKKYGKEVTYTQIQDESLIGGVKLIVGQKEIDFSVKKRIEAVAKVLQSK